MITQLAIQQQQALYGQKSTLWPSDSYTNNITVSYQVSLQNIFTDGGTIELICIITPGLTGNNRLFIKLFQCILIPSGELYAANFQHYFNPTAGSWITNYILKPNVIYRISIVYNKSSTDNDPIIYVNGDSKSITEITAPSGSVASDAARNLIIGNRIENDRGFWGRIIDFRVWNDIRTEDEIKQNMFKTLVGNESGLVGYWKLNEGSGSTAYNSVSGGNNGSMNNVNWYGS